MWITMLVLTISLVCVYKRKLLASKIGIILAVLLYLATSFNDITNTILMITSGVVGLQVLMWELITILLLIFSCFAIFKNSRKASIWLLWLLIVFSLLSNWNILFTYIIQLRRAFLYRAVHIV